MFSDYEEKFEIAHKPVANIEGGFVDHPNDPGGVTNFGISLRFLQDYIKTESGRKVCSKLGITSANRSAIVGMTHEKAKEIYYNAFWKSPRIDELPLYLAVVTYDFGVNSGTSYAIKVLQKSIGAKVDGKIGPETLGLAEEVSQKRAVEAMLKERVKYYKRLAQNTKYIPFLNGWLNRVTALQRYLNGLK